MDILSDVPVTVILIAINIIASLYAFANRDFLEENTFHVGPVRAGQWSRMLTSGFLHVNMLHLALNMFVLFQFGPPIEGHLGALNYSLLYFAALLGGNLWALLDNWKKSTYRAVGASGAISGVIASFCLFLPTATLWLFAVIPMPALVLLVLLLAGSAYLSTRPNTVIGHEAHFGGALAGVIVTVMIAPYAWSTFVEALTGLLG